MGPRYMQGSLKCPLLLTVPLGLIRLSCMPLLPGLDRFDNVMRSPHLDELAAQGVKLSNYYVQVSLFVMVTVVVLLLLPLFLVVWSLDSDLCSLLALLSAENSRSAPPVAPRCSPASTRSTPACRCAPHRLLTQPPRLWEQVVAVYVAV